MGEGNGGRRVSHQALMSRAIWSSMRMFLKSGRDLHHFTSLYRRWGFILRLGLLCLLYYFHVQDLKFAQLTWSAIMVRVATISSPFLGPDPPSPAPRSG